MHDIICPHCHKAFKVDESGYADILKQVRDADFHAQLHERLELAESFSTEVQRRVDAARDPLFAGAASGNFALSAGSGQMASSATSAATVSCSERMRARNDFVRSCWGLLMTSSGGPVSTTTPASMKTTRSATSRAKPIS